MKKKAYCGKFHTFISILTATLTEQETPLNHNLSEGIIISNMSLVLQRVRWEGIV